MENKEGETGCCSKAKCCGGKALAAIGLLAIGGLGGYLCGHRCGLKQASAPAVSAPASPTK
jgi:hypothetical protein